LGALNTVSTFSTLALDRDRTIPPERPPLVGEVGANFMLILAKCMVRICIPDH
jgi:hypothetical protein